MGGRWDGSRLLLCSVYIIWLRQLCLCLCVYVSVWLYGCQYVNTSVLILTGVSKCPYSVHKTILQSGKWPCVCESNQKYIYHCVWVFVCMYVCVCVCVCVLKMSSVWTQATHWKLNGRSDSFIQDKLVTKALFVLSDLPYQNIWTPVILQLFKKESVALQ